MAPQFHGHRLVRYKNQDNLYLPFTAVEELPPGSGGRWDICALLPHVADRPVWSFFQAREYWRDHLGAKDSEVYHWIAGEGMASNYGIYRLSDPKYRLVVPGLSLESGYVSVLGERASSFDSFSDAEIAAMAQGEMVEPGMSAGLEWNAEENDASNNQFEDAYFLPSQIKFFFPQFRLMSFAEVVKKWNDCGLSKQDTEKLLAQKIIDINGNILAFSDKGQRVRGSGLDIQNLFFSDNSIEVITQKKCPSRMRKSIAGAPRKKRGAEATTRRRNHNIIKD